MRVLFTTPILEHPAAGGPQLRIENSIKALGRVCELHVASRASRANIGGPRAEAFYKGLCESFTYTPSGRWRSANRYVRKAQTILGGITGADVRRDTRFLLRLIDASGIDALWFGYGNISYPLIRAIRAARPRLKMVCDTDSVWSRFVLRQLPYAQSRRHRAAIERSGRRKEAEERSWVELCDVTTAVSDVDAEYYRSIASVPGRIHRFSNVIDLATYEDVPPPPAGFKRPSMFLAGTFGRSTSAMNTATQWVLDEILPRVRERIPGVHFYVVGRDSDRALTHAAGPSVTVTGKLPSVLPYLCHADVSLVPLKFESGTRFKILEAAACGVPIVSTVLGAEGLPVVHGTHVMLGDEPDAFASAILEIISDRSLAATLSRNCRALVQERFSVEHLCREGSEILGLL